MPISQSQSLLLRRTHLGDFLSQTAVSGTDVCPFLLQELCFLMEELPNLPESLAWQWYQVEEPLMPAGGRSGGGGHSSGRWGEEHLLFLHLMRWWESRCWVSVS